MHRAHLLTLLPLLGVLSTSPAAGPLPHRTPLANDPGSACSRAAIDIDVAQAAPQDPKSRGMRLRAAYVSKIAAYITPKAKAKPTKAPHVIAVVGSDAFADAIIKLLPGKAINKRKVKVIVLDPTIAATSTKHQYQMLYVATSVDPAVAARIIKSHKKLATPLMSSRSAFASKGGGVQLFIKNNKVKFEVNQKALKTQGMKVSPHLMKLSTKGPIK